MNKDIDIKDILSIIKHNLLFILSIVVISILMAMIYLKFQLQSTNRSINKIKDEGKQNIKGNPLLHHLQLVIQKRM